MDAVMHTAKRLIPSLSWRLKQAFTFAFAFGVLAALLTWMENPVVSELLYAIPYLIAVTFPATVFLWGFAAYYEWQRGKL